MKSFREYIKEDGVPNSTGIFTYGLGFFADMVPTDFDVEDYSDSDDPRDRKKLPWEIENALEANRRRDMILRWLKKAGAKSSKAVTDKSLPQTPNWQTTKR
jgi:hypothetical protein